MNEGDMEIIDCNNHVKSAINFFGPSCAVNSLIDKYNPIGRKIIVYKVYIGFPISTGILILRYFKSFNSISLDI